MYTLQRHQVLHMASEQGPIALKLAKLELQIPVDQRV